MGLIDFLLGRLDGIWHILRGHRLEWKSNRDRICAGDIVCHTCSLLIWCRWNDPRWLGGHKEDPWD